MGEKSSNSFFGFALNPELLLNREGGEFTTTEGEVLDGPPLLVLTAYDPHVPHTELGGGDLITDQRFKEECDINAIVKRFSDRRLPIPPPIVAGTYADFSQFETMEDAYDAIKNIEEYFLELPAEIRDKFGQDVEEFLAAFCCDEGLKDINDAIEAYNKDIHASAQEPPEAIATEGE